MVQLVLHLADILRVEAVEATAASLVLVEEAKVRALELLLLQLHKQQVM
jgi:hypothetical protein